MAFKPEDNAPLSAELGRRGEKEKQNPSAEEGARSRLGGGESCSLQIQQSTWLHGVVGHVKGLSGASTNINHTSRPAHSSAAQPGSPEKALGVLGGAEAGCRRASLFRMPLCAPSLMHLPPRGSVSGSLRSETWTALTAGSTPAGPCGHRRSGLAWEETLPRSLARLLGRRVDERKMKARAPPPPGKPAAPDVHGGWKPSRDVSPGPQQKVLNMREDLGRRVVDITVVLPSGLEKETVVNGSHAMMDLLVELCLQNHLNPSTHALEIRSSENQQPLSFKPNTLVGTLNVHTVFLKEKVPEAKVKAGPSKVPEKTVRLVVNYLRTQKAVVRVSPVVPLAAILPLICAKCGVSPEHVVLLRDDVTGDELELSKSLSELGIKELYAWDNKRETFRKSSFGSDETDKEKKKILGFFKVNKRSSSKGCLTTPNSPSVNSRSTTLGPSLSLSSISGVSVKSDLKKRRAPPPPSGPRAGPPMQDKASEKVSLGSQADFQKKKRRAPAPPPPQPPPPSPLVPARTEDREEGRKGRTGVGRQVPQKPPRGAARGPPQLELPPPPPYPPPAAEAGPPGCSGTGAASLASDPRPTLSLPLGPGSPCSVDGVPPVPPEAEETVSVGSCIASEDTTEDSGVMSSPSDGISLDSQHDSMKSKDKWTTDQEDCSDQDLVGTPELGPPKSPSWERSSSGGWPPRSETAASGEHEDLRLSRWPQDTLAEPEEELGEMENRSALSNSAHGCPRDAAILDGDEEPIPVTFIGEVLDDPVDAGLFSNRNNNAGSSDTGSTHSTKAPLPPCQAAPGQQPGMGRAATPDPPSPSEDAGKETKPAASSTWKDVNPNKTEPQTTSAPALHTRALDAREGKASGSAPSRTPPATGRLDSQPVRETEGGANSDVSTPPSWYQRGQHPGGSYGLKYGLTTYKIVPPKSEMRCYDRGVSLSTGAIKIDELGNLVSPQAPVGRTLVPGAPSLEAEPQPIGKVKEFWRSNSTEEPLGQPTGGSAKRTPTPSTPAKPQPQEGRPRAEPTSPDPKGTVPPPHPEDGGPLEERRSWPPTAAPRPEKVTAANTAEVHFLKPQRRTSSQYMASAIAKRIGTQKVHLETRVGNDGEGSAVGAHPGAHTGSPYRRSSTQDCPAGVLRNSHVPLVTASPRDQGPPGRSCGLSQRQSASNQRTRSASDPRCTPDTTSPPPPCSGDDQTPGPALVNGSRWVPVPSEPPHSPREIGTNGHAGREPLGREEKPRLLSTDALETDGTQPASIFGPKKRFRPVVQRPAPKDMSLHSALMEAIHSAGGKDGLRKIAEHSPERGPKTPSHAEADSERSALLAAIRGHRGACSLRKVSSSASEELQSFRDAVLSAHGSGPPGPEDLGVQFPAAPPPPPPPATQTPITSRTAPRASSGPLSSPGDARQALLDAIRSGTGAARLRKVPLLV
ncbi:protein cordon-bleu isoform X8 [Camelus ferus]|uniref:Protein cordon-bleu isoform X8 n=1 Tax=Camelus ferus TaxID=419612 RepID=A0A8B8SPQ2_CAMFR|nr:protein cordon-bleu isoform X8 [Camelus ferus]